MGPSQVKSRMSKRMAGARASPPASRRTTERLAIELPVSIRGSRRGASFKELTRTLDLSRCGALFAARRSYRTGMNLQLRFLKLQGRGPEQAGVPAQVVRVTRPSPGGTTAVAVHFQDAELATLAFGELLRAEIRVSSALLGVIRALSPRAEISAVIEDICHAAQQALEAEQVLLFLPGPSAGALLAHTRTAGHEEEIQIKPGEGLVGKAAASGKIKNLSAPSRRSLYHREGEETFEERTRSALCVPLKKEGGIRPGVLVFVNKRYGSFTREDEELGSAIANQISAVLRDARLFESVRHMKNFNERVLQTIGTGILTFDSLGKLTTINRAGSEILDLQSDSCVGSHYRELFRGAANARIVSLLEDVLSRNCRRTAADVRFQSSGGVGRSLDLSVLPLPDLRGDSQGAVLVAEDITHEQRLMKTLCRYMAREVAERLLQTSDALKLRGTRTDVTILITDIRSFTALSEQMDPWDVFNLLNAYFPRLINVIFRHHGMVDKFVGDSILAVFGVPMPREDDALRAAQTALELRKELSAINKERARKGLTTIEMGIGITSGTVISGNIGSERRMDYTVIGDPVNLAARLEGLTREVERRILINERVHAAIEKEIACDSLGLFQLKGKREKVPVFAIRTPEQVPS